MTEELQKRVDTLEKSLDREKAARKMAETLLEQRSREIYESNQSLKNQANEAKLQQLQLSFLTGLSADIWNADSVNATVQVYLRRASEFLNNAQCIFFQLKQANSNAAWKLASVMELEQQKAAKKSRIDVLEQDDIDALVIRDLVQAFDFKTILEAVEDSAGESTLLPMNSISSAKTKFEYAYLVPLFSINNNRGFACFVYSDSTKIDILKLQSVESSRSMLAVAVQRQMATVNLGNRFKELEKTHKKLDDAQRQLIQSERMASVGQLAAGVAHEINNPIGFVISNYETLTEYVEVLNRLLDKVPKVEKDSSVMKEITDIWQEEDVDFIMSDVNSLLTASKGGLKRVQDIVAGLKSFSHSDASSYTPISLNDCIEDSIQLVWNELKYNCELVKNLAEISTIKANFGQIEQVIVNMLINAKHAMEEGGTITISTVNAENQVTLTISDTGSGISEKNQEKLFTPFFTTKPVGVGTGLGLSISYGILQDHGAEISVESQLGVGTTFKIVFPAYSE